MPRKKKKSDKEKAHKPAFHEGLEGFDIKVNTFGQMESTFEIDKLNAFLNQEVGDKKMKEKAEAKEKEKEKAEEKPKNKMKK